MAFEFSLDDLTVGDIIDLEEALGVNWSEVVTQITSGRFDLITGKAMAAFVWITARRVDETVTYEDVRKMNWVDLFAQFVPDNAAAVD